MSASAAGSEAADPGFAIKDCALISIATGRAATNYKEFRDNLLTAPPDSIYHHFWGELIRPFFEEREYNNDFAGWFARALHDQVLAERLAIIAPNDFPDIESLRERILVLLDERVDEAEYLPWLRAIYPFEFIRSQIVVFDTRIQLDDPAQLAQTIPHLSTSSVFYHFIDARRRLHAGTDDFSEWLRAYGDTHTELCKRLATLDPYFTPLKELQMQLSQLFSRYFTDG